MRRIILGIIVALVLPGASWESSARADTPKCTPVVQTVHEYPLNDATPEMIEADWTFSSCGGAYPVDMDVTNCGALASDIQGTITTGGCVVDNNYWQSVSYWDCKDNLLSHKQHFWLDGVNWSEYWSSDHAWHGPFGYNFAPDLSHSKIRCGIL